MTDHHIIKSIYFFDPNGILLELTTRTASEEEMRAAEAEAHPALLAWTEEKTRRADAARR